MKVGLRGEPFVVVTGMSQAHRPAVCPLWKVPGSLSNAPTAHPLMP